MSNQKQVPTKETLELYEQYLNDPDDAKKTHNSYSQLESVGENAISFLWKDPDELMLDVIDAEQRAAADSMRVISAKELLVKHILAAFEKSTSDASVGALVKCIDSIPDYR